MLFRLQKARHGSPAGRRGFTLLEMLVVTSVVALLTSIMLPSFRKAREDTRRTVCVANLKHIGMGLFTYAAENREHGPQVMSPMGGGPRAPRNLLSDGGGRVNMALMLPQVMQDPRVFRCPSQTEFQYQPKFEAIGSELVGCSYAYAVSVPAEQSPKLGSIRHLALVSDDFVAPSGDVGIGKYSHRVGYNVLYTDGSATWYPDPDESIWKRRVYWDREGDDLNYTSLYREDAPEPGGYARSLDIFRVWYSFCYAQPDPF